MPLEKQEFDALLRLSYPDAALVSPLLNEHNWERLRDADKVELTRLAGEVRPLADLYNYVDYRMNQTVMYANARSTVEIGRSGPGSDWEPPHVAPGDTREAALRRLYESCGRADAAARRANQELKGFTPGPAAGSRAAGPTLGDGARGPADSTGTAPAARSPHVQPKRPGPGQAQGR